MSSTAHVQKKSPDVRGTQHLISLLIPDYLRLVEPDSAAQMDLTSCTTVTATEDDEANLLRTLVKSRRGQDVTVIVAIEPEALPTPLMAQKLARVLESSKLTDGVPVLLSVIYLSGGRPGVHLETAQLAALGDLEQVRIYFTVWGLSDSRAESYLLRPEPLAWALAPSMHSTSQTQQELLEASRSRVTQAQLSDDLRETLLDFLSSGLESEDSRKHTLMTTILR